MQLHGNTRIEWIDWAKTIGIFLMVLGHGGLVDKGCVQLIFSFHMPLFFIISGMLYKNRPFIDAIKKGGKTLLIPYLIINAILLTYNLFIHIVGGNTLTMEFLYNRIAPIFLGLGYVVDNLIPVCTPLWFLVVLFMIQTIFAISHKWQYHMCITLLGIIIFKVLDHYEIDTLVPIDSALLAMPFFFIGHVFKNMFSKKVSIYALPIIALALVIVNFYNGRVDICEAKFGNSMLLMYTSGILGTILTFTFSRLFNGDVKSYASGLVVIVGFNLLYISITKKIWMLILPNIDITPPIGFILAFIICIAFYPIIILCRKYFKPILGYR